MKKNTRKKPTNFPIYRILIGAAFYLFIITFLNTSAPASIDNKQNPVPKHFVQVQNNKLYLKQQQFIPIGINHFDMESLWNPHITTPTHDWITRKDFAAFQKAGFNSIRIAVKTDYFWDAQNKTFNEQSFLWLDNIIALARQYDQRLIIDMHMPTGGAQQDYNPNDQNSLFWENSAYLGKFVEVWREISKRYANEPTIWAYDLMNEPATWDLTTYNNLILQTVASIRTHDTNHILIIQPGMQLIDGEAKHVYPEIYDTQIVHSLHFYEPHAFTHQNVSWGISGDQAIISYPTTSSSLDIWDRQRLINAYKQAAYNAGYDQYPVIMTEFGTVFHNYYTGQDQWIADVITAASEMETGWHYWYYKANKYSEEMGITTQNSIIRPIIWKVLKQKMDN